MDIDHYRLSESRSRDIYLADIYPTIFRNATRQDHPRAVIFGGQPGAGKTAAIDIAVREFGKAGCVQIIGDDLRAYHPQYAALNRADDQTAAAYTDRDAGRWVEMAIADAAKQGVNVVVEGTMRRPEVVVATMKQFRDAGYTVDARVLSVHERDSRLGILLRYELQKANRGYGRMTAPTAHAAAYAGVVESIARIEANKAAHSLTIIQRDNVILYRNELDTIKNEWRNPPRGREVIEQDRMRSRTVQETRDHLSESANLVSMVTKTNRHASQTEIRVALDQLKDARNLFATTARSSLEPEHQALLRQVAAEVFRSGASRESALEAFPELATAFSALDKILQSMDSRQQSNKQYVQHIDEVRNKIAAGIESGSAWKSQRAELNQESPKGPDLSR